MLVFMVLGCFTIKSYPNGLLFPQHRANQYSNGVFGWLAGWFDKGKKVLSLLILWFSFIFQEPVSEIPSPYLFLFLFTTLLPHSTSLLFLPFLDRGYAF